VEQIVVGNRTLYHDGLSQSQTDYGICRVWERTCIDLRTCIELRTCILGVYLY